MTEQTEQLEKELNTIWQNAPNTRKGTAPRRIDTILERSQAELSLRDLLLFFIYLGQACLLLSLAVVQALFVAPEAISPQQDTKK